MAFHGGRHVHVVVDQEDPGPALLLGQVVHELLEPRGPDPGVELRLGQVHGDGGALPSDESTTTVPPIWRAKP
jgi:hypothetical protein